MDVFYILLKLYHLFLLKTPVILMSCTIIVVLKESLIHSQKFLMLKARIRPVLLFFEGMEHSEEDPI